MEKTAKFSLHEVVGSVVNNEHLCDQCHGEMLDRPSIMAASEGTPASFRLVLYIVKDMGKEVRLVQDRWSSFGWRRAKKKYF